MLIIQCEKERNMNIDEELNEIIFKYHLDRHYPHYRNMYESEKILRNVVKNIIQYGKKAIFVGNDSTEIEIIRNMSKDNENIDFLDYDRKDISLEQLESICWQDYEEIYLISYYGAEYAERWFRMHSIKYAWIYDIFEKEGIYLQRAFYAFGKEDLYALIVPDYEHVSSRDGWTESFQCELYCQQSKYDSADDCVTKRIALEKCLFLTLYMRNFEAAQRYVLLLSQDDKRFERLWKEIQNLLSCIKKLIDNREQKDIILYWLDAIPYGDEKDMSYLQSVMQDSIVFENAFTYMPNTHPALRAMFLGKKDIDDLAYYVGKVTHDNSPVIRFLEEQGYGIKVFSGHFPDYFPSQFVSDHFYMDSYETISMKLWDMLSYMLLEKRPTLWIIHAMETHSPCLNSRISDDNCKIGSERYRQSRLEVDEQLSFYDSFLNRNAFRIYMSDHGRMRVPVHTDKKIRFHILFNIYHSAWEPRKIEGLFSLLDFEMVLKQLILNGNIKEEEFLREYVEIGTLDWYNSKLIAKIFRKKTDLPIACFGYKGVVDKEYIYIRYKMGKEWFQKRDNMPSFNPRLFCDDEDEICEPTLLPRYRKLVGGYPESIETDEELTKYSKYLYAVYHNVLKHNNMTERVDIINRLLEGYPDGSIGLRMGGQHSETLYSYLSEENKKKIWGFLDYNEECQCSKLHLPIACPDRLNELKAEGVKAVLLSSYDYLEELREEAKSYSADIAVLDIYDCFEKYGILCKGIFWEIKALPEDFDVGFPLNN